MRSRIRSFSTSLSQLAFIVVACLAACSLFALLQQSTRAPREENSDAARATDVAQKGAASAASTSSSPLLPRAETAGAETHFV